MQTFSSRRLAVARGVLAVIIVVVIVIAGIAAYAYVSTSKPSSTTTSSISSTVQSSSSLYSSITQSTSTAAPPSKTTLTIDDVFWPAGDLNQLNTLGEIPYPNWLTYTVYQSLITLNASALYNQGTLQYLPMLAANWTESPDGTTYTFNLRNGVTFSNGDPLNSYQIWAQMYGLYYLSGNSTGWLESYNVFNMAPVTFGPSTVTMLNDSGLIHPNAAALAMMENSTWPIYVTSPSQIVFHLQSPFNYFLGTLVVYNGMIFDTQWLLDHGGFGTPALYNPYFNSNPIPGTGPYVVTQVSTNSFVKFTQNPTYWGANLTSAQVSANPYIDPGHYKNVIVNAKFDDVARYTDLSTGQAQIAGILSQDWPLITANPNTYGYFQFPSKAAVFVGIAMNTQIYPTNITAVRQAIVHAINYTDISDKVFFGGLNPMIGPEYPVYSQFYNLGSQGPYQFNLTESEQILQKAGITSSVIAKFPPLNFRVVVGCEYCIDAAEEVSNQLAALNMTVNIIVTPSASYGFPLTGGTESYSSALSVANQISQFTWFGTGTFAPAADTPADAWLLFVNNATTSNNWAIYANPTVQKCVNAWTTTTNTTLLTNLCTAAQQQVWNDAPYIWLGTIKLFFGAGSIAYDKDAISSFYVDPVYSGQSSTVIFNTVVPAG
ncbi:MAG TPA: ABC transporter substrate-binding protein [Nitrososphaerales archaeon]|nr:ABC transporter substrate-binding protein [Nitrososphaerales archaeon]